MKVPNKFSASERKIFIKGARVHNLKNVDVELPKNKFIVITGVSGSGKSSLTIDTLYAEGQRRYVESLSSYARQFLNRMDKPDVDYIKGLCPAIAIEQKVSTRTTRSTVGSLTEIYDYLRLLFARIGKTYSPKTGELVTKHEVRDVVDFLFKQKEGDKVFIYFENKVNDKFAADLNLLLQKGFTRVKFNGEVAKIEELLENKDALKKKQTSIKVLVDRLVMKHDDEDLKSRAADSIQTAFSEGHGDCIIELLNTEGKETEHTFSNKFEADGISFEEPNPNFFNFNNPYGACKTCEGFGTVMGIDEELIFPDKELSVYEGAIAPWKGEKMSEWAEPLIKKGVMFDFPIHRAYKDLEQEHKDLLWTGNKYFAGLHEFFRYLEEKSYKIQYRVMLSRFRGKTTCPDCKGSRIRKDAQYVKIQGRNISELTMQPIKELHAFFKTIKLSESEATIAKRILLEVNGRLQTMMDVGLGYLTLNRLSNTLSGGETQRINLTRSIGSNLTSSMYILDEPSIGLHQRDTDRLIGVLKNLRDLGNTVIVVEHDEDIMKTSDHIVDMGPEAGRFGGEVMYNGSSKDMLKANTLTAKYLNGEMEIIYNPKRRKPSNWIEIIGASQHNLKNVSAKFPLGALTVVSGVSGSGKTTLIKKILYPALMRLFDGAGEKPGSFREMKGDMSRITAIEMIDQNPLGRSSRSNPVTYVKAYDGIRDLYARMQLSKIRGYQPKDFSFNVEGGRCETCKGEGEVVVEMQFLADVHLKCEACNGKKFKEEVLEVQYKGKNIYEILELSVDEAVEFFKEDNEITTKLLPLQKVGLGYVKLGQSSSTLSGGEAQRVKLASFLNKGAAPNPILFIFDEPTTGLHFHDINKLMSSFNQLIEAGHSVIVIEHNMDVIKCADWLIDLGPEGGDEGGELVYQGIPEGILSVKNSYTATYLRPKLHLN
ncbi:MAG TPA: excinuclease ABC subunit UvrA [Chitinophagales bacterium]|nr:excinuclease ABC subunit UvrA [Chitinophagales bacterium]